MATVQNTTRVTGLFSGMDTDELVRAMVMNQQNRVDQLSRKMQKAEWKRDAYTKFNDQLKLFRENFTSALGAESILKKSAFVAYSVNMAQNNALQVSGTANAKGGAYNVRIDQIASAASMKGSKLTDGFSGLSDNTINRTAISDIQSFSSGAFASSNGRIDFSINGEAFSFAATDTLKTVMDTVNKSKAGVTMSYSQISDSISIVSNQTGASQGLLDPGAVAPVDPAARAEYDRQLAEYQADAKKNITFDDNSGFLAHLGLTTVEAGRNAKVSINGSAVRELDTNSLTLDGINMTFMQETGSEGVSFTLEPNRQSSLDHVKKFIEQLNSVVADLFTAHTSKSKQGYNPLVESQKEAMSEKEIELWETEAKKGVLYRDDELGRLLSGIRGLLTQNFGENGGTLASIGIKTTAYSPGKPFALEIDEEKLTKALEEDADRVYNIFAETASGTNKGGFAVQVGKLIDTYTGNTKSYGIQNLNNNISDYTKKIKEQTKKMDAAAERYYLQYAKMESAMSKMSEQQNSLAGLFPTQA